MERQKNSLRHVTDNKTLLPIEEEFLLSVKRAIENSIGSPITHWTRHYTHPIYDCYLIVSNDKPYLVKVNVSPDAPNFWEELSANNFNFHPKIVCYSGKEDEFKFICFEVPKGVFASDISNYILSPKLNLAKTFISDFSSIHSVKLGEEDKTVEVFNSFLPKETIMIYKTYPVVELFSTAKNSFKSLYNSNPNHCGLCHFDVSPENIIYTGSEFKFINFEYAANANIYLDIWLAKKTLNCSDQAFEAAISSFNRDQVSSLYLYKDIQYLFNFGYFNSKIISEYMTFGLKNTPKLKYWIDQSAECYNKISDKLFVEKSLDNLIRDFYLLWK